MYSIDEIEDAFFNYEGVGELTVEGYNELSIKWRMFKAYLGDNTPADKENLR
jgi:hypothetical protein